MQDVMDMSLDDYINSFKKSDPDKNLIGAVHKEESKFKEGRRELNENDDDDELVVKCEEDDYVSLALNNTDNTLASIDSNDLRHRIGRFPNANSQQWRLMHPNVVHTRPAGMPPLVPTDSVPNGISLNRNNRRNNKNKYRNWFGKQNCNGNNNNNNNRNYGRIQRFGGNNCRSNVNSKDIKIVLQQLKDRNPMILYTEAGAPDLTIEATTCERDRKSTTTIVSIPQLMKSNSQQVVKDPDSSGPSKGSEAIKSLLGVNEVSLRNEMIPALASKLLDFLNGVSPSVHKPQYDMKIQREIHEIQKKPLLYKCPGGEVVSSDGVGIPNCQIQPKASGVSLNNRFA